ncbi:MAG TPA: hypothetical protein VKP69_09670, partial [Isosphaeraceae bacterium]|nr:hypothetical protein [Isosphaeraceae bacterium]
RWETLLLWLLHVAEEAFGIDDTTFTERAVPYELAMEPHGAMTLERLILLVKELFAFYLVLQRYFELIRLPQVVIYRMVRFI